MEHCKLLILPEHLTDFLEQSWIDHIFLQEEKTCPTIYCFAH